MKIGFISTHTNATPPLGYGGEVFYANLVKGLAEKGHEVHLFATGGSDIPKGGKLHLIPSAPEGQIQKWIEDWLVNKYASILMDMDIVHDCSLDHVPAEKLRYLYGKKEIINTINGTTYYMPRPPFNVVTGSRFWQNDALSVGLPTEMVYWGVDTEFYTPQIKHNADSDVNMLLPENWEFLYNKEDYLLWIARFHPSKGLEIALELAEVLGFKLKVAGSMQFKDHRFYGEKYLEIIEKLPNVEYVELPQDHRHHEAKRELMQKAMAFLYPVNYKECFGMVVAEAMACGTPVIATPNGAMPELIDDNTNGFICKTKREFSQAITKQLPYYWENRKHHEGFDLWKNARKKAEQFDVSKSVDAYEKLYEKVIGGYSWGPSGIPVMSSEQST